MLKPGFFTNEQLCELPYEARLCFEGLWCLADRSGRLADRPKRIKAELFPYDALDVDPLLQQLAVAGFIRRYVVEGEPLIAVLQFHKHQHPHVREAASELPPPPRVQSENGTGRGNGSIKAGAGPRLARTRARAGH